MKMWIEGFEPVEVEVLGPPDWYQTPFIDGGGVIVRNESGYGHIRYPKRLHATKEEAKRAHLVSEIEKLIKHAESCESEAADYERSIRSFQRSEAAYRLDAAELRNKAAELQARLGT